MYNVSALALTSLDSVARIGRMSLQELFKDDSKEVSGISKIMTNKYFATIITLVIGLVLSLGGYNNVWPLFGAANQLLSALVLITLAVFLKSTKRKGFMLWAPMVVMLSVTFTALVQAILGIMKKIGAGQFVFLTDGLQLIFALLLISLGFVVAVSCFKKLFSKDNKVEAASNNAV